MSDNPVVIDEPVHIDGSKTEEATIILGLDRPTLIRPHEKVWLVGQPAFWFRVNSMDWRVDGVAERVRVLSLRVGNVLQFLEQHILEDQTFPINALPKSLFPLHACGPSTQITIELQNEQDFETVGVSVSLKGYRLS